MVVRRYIGPIVAGACAALLFAGCYTQMAALDRAEVVSEPSYDSSAAPLVPDTVRERRICFWRRDFFGRPVLRCYRDYYSADWQYYSDYPWWYSNYARHEDYGCHCPYHMTYQPSCRYCWDRCERYYRYECTTCPRGDYAPRTSGGGASSATPAGTSSSRGRGGASRGGTPVQRSPNLMGPMPGSADAQGLLGKPATEPAPADSAKANPGQVTPSVEPSIPDTSGAPSMVPTPRRRFGRRR